jgi:hypothetical protein
LRVACAACIKRLVRRIRQPWCLSTGISFFCPDWKLDSGHDTGFRTAGLITGQEEKLGFGFSRFFGLDNYVCINKTADMLIEMSVFCRNTGEIVVSGSYNQ